MPQASRVAIVLSLLLGLVVWGLTPADASPAGASPTTGDESTLAHVQLNQWTAGQQSETTVATLPAGGWAAVWASSRQAQGSGAVVARRVDAEGRWAGPEVLVHPPHRGLQNQPAVTWVATPDATADSLWIVWRSEALGEASVVARRFSADLEPLGPEQSIATGAVGSPVVSTVDGTVMVAWSKSEPQGTSVWMRRLQAAGPAIEEEQRLGSGGVMARPVVARRGNPASASELVVAWVDASDSAIIGRRIGSQGVPSALQTWVADRPGAVIEPTLVWTPDGLGLLAWLEDESTGYAIRWSKLLPTSDRTETVPAQRIGRLAGPETGWKHGLQALVDPEGGFALLYGNESMASRAEGAELWLQRFGPTVEPTAAPQSLGGGEARSVAVVSSTPRAAWSAEGALAVAWQGTGVVHPEDDRVDPSAAGLTLWSATGFDPTTIARRGILAPVQGLATPQNLVTSDQLAAPTFDPNAPTRARQPFIEGAGGDFGFEAIPATGWTPPDPEVAVGPERIVGITNGEIAVFDKLGNLQWNDEIENSFGFWGELGTDNFVFDPEVVWDPQGRRFVAMANERSDDNRGNFLLAISKDERPDDRDDWWKYRLDVTALADGGIDSPNLAVGRDTILLTADFFGPDRFLLYLIDKASVIDGGLPITTSELITGQHSMGTPTVRSDTGTLYILESTELSVNTTVRIHAITEPFTNYQRQVETLAVPTYTIPADPPQQGSSSRFELFEPRFWSVVENAGSLWAVHHVDNTRARVRWYEIDLQGWPATEGATPTVAQTGEIDPGSNVFTFFPSIAVDSAGNAAITFARSATDEFPSMGRAVRAFGDPPDTFRPIQMVQTSVSSTNSSRWGDYSGTAAEPDETGTFWGFHEYLPGGVAWSTWIARYELQDAPFLLTANPPAAGTTIELSVTGATPGETVFFYATDQGLGLSEIAGLDVVLSLEAATEVGSDVANGLGEASVLAAVPAGADAWVQAAEPGRTTDFTMLGADTPIFVDGFESGDTTAWSTTTP